MWLVALVSGPLSLIGYRLSYVCKHKYLLTSPQSLLYMTSHSYIRVNFITCYADVFRAATMPALRDLWEKPSPRVSVLYQHCVTSRDSKLLSHDLMYDVVTSS